jgi:hypothetical protein
MNKMYRLLLLSMLIVITALPQQDINQQMKTFTGRVKVYLKCLRNKCSKQEREQVTPATIAKDGALILGTIVAIGTGAFLGKKYGWPKWRKYRLLKENKKEIELTKKQIKTLNDLATKEQDPKQKKVIGKSLAESNKRLQELQGIKEALSTLNI